jgi:hypothetical protein
MDACFTGALLVCKYGQFEENCGGEDAVRFGAEGSEVGRKPKETEICIELTPLWAKGDAALRGRDQRPELGDPENEPGCEGARLA